MGAGVRPAPMDTICFRWAMSFSTPAHDNDLMGDPDA